MMKTPSKRILAAMLISWLTSAYAQNTPGQTYVSYDSVNGRTTYTVPGGEAESGGGSGGSSAGDSTNADIAEAESIVSEAASLKTEVAAETDKSKEAAETAKAEVSGEKANADSDKAGDPVRITTGEFYLEESDFGFPRIYASNSPGGPSFGKGWFFFADSRIIRGVDIGALSAKNRIKSRIIDPLQEKWERADLLAARTASCADEAREAKRILNEALEEYELVRDQADRAMALASRNTLSWWSGLPMGWMGIGNDSLLLINPEGVPHIFVPDGAGEWKALDPDAARSDRIASIDRADALSAQGFVYTASNGASYRYDSNGLLIRAEKRNPYGDPLIREISRNTGTGGIRDIIDAYGYRYAVEGERQRIDAIVDPLGRKIVYSHGSDALSSVTDFENDSIGYGYSLGRLAEIVKPMNAKTKIIYGQTDRKGRPLVTETINEEGHPEYFEYRPAERKTLWTSPDGDRKIIEWDESHRTVSIEESGKPTIRYIRDQATGDVLREESMQGTTVHEYDQRGNRTTTLYPDGSREILSFDENDRLVERISRGGTLETYRWDAWGVSGIFREGRTLKTIERNENGFIVKIVEDGKYIANIQRDAHNKPIRILQGAGDEIIRSDLAWDAAGRIVSFIDGERRKIEWKYGRHAMIIVDQAGLETSWKWNSRKDIVEITEKDTVGGETRKRETIFDKRHLPLKETLNGKEIARYAWTANGKKASIIRGRLRTDFAYSIEGKEELTQTYAGSEPFRIVRTKELTPSGAIITVQDGSNRAQTLRYDSENRLLSKQSGNLAPESFAWDPDGSIARLETRLGGIVDLQRNKKTGEFKQFRNGELASRMVKSPTGKILEYTDENGSLVSNEYDSTGFLIRERRSAGFVSYERDKTGTAVSRNVFGADGELIESVSISRSHDLRSAVVLEGGIYRKEYRLNGWGEVTGFADGENNDRSFDRDAFGRVEVETDPYGNETRYKYDDFGEISKIVYCDGSFEAYERNSAGLVVRETDAAGVSAEYDYDAGGRRISEYTRGGVRLSRTFDDSGRTQTLNRGDDNALVFNFEYSSDGKTIASKDASGNSMISIFDGFGRLVGETNRLHVSSSHRWDARSRAIEGIDGKGVKTSRRYISDGSKIIEETGGGGRIEIIKDAAGREIARCNDTTKIEFDFDQAGRIVGQKDALSGAEMQFFYDKAGRMIRAKGSGRDVRRRLGKNNEILEARDLSNGLTITFAYDARGREIRRTFANGIQIERGYDEAGRISWIREKKITGEILRAEAWAYDENGRRRLGVDEEGMITRYSWNSRGELVCAETPADAEGGDGLERVIFSPEDIRTAVSLMGKFLPGAAPSVSESQVVRKERYAYDQNGNMTEIRLGGNSIRMEYDAENRLTKRGEVSFSYDKNGNLVKMFDLRNSLVCSYNDKNRMVRSVVADGMKNSIVSTDYAYDGYGRRSSIQDDGAGAMVASYIGTGFDMFTVKPVQSAAFATDDSSGSRYRWIGDAESSRSTSAPSPSGDATTHSLSSRELLTLGGFPAASSVGGANYYYGKSVNESVASLSDVSGAFQKLPRMNAFGGIDELASNSSLLGSSVFDHPSFVSKYRSPATSLMDFGYRDYAPSLSRFTTPDPIRDGYNWYTYCASDPINFVDLWGLSYLDGLSETMKQITNNESTLYGMPQNVKTTLAIATVKRSADNNLGQVYEVGINDCDIWTESVLSEVGDNVTNSWLSAKDNNVKTHMSELSSKLSDEPVSGVNLVFQNEDHVGIAIVNIDNSFTLYHQGYQSPGVTESGKKGYTSFEQFENAWSGTKTYVPVF